jgi:glycosyltransferase involved in cell wall biosynthesis
VKNNSTFTAMTQLVDYEIGVPEAARRYRVAYLAHTSVASGAELALARLLPSLGEVDSAVILAEEGPLVGLLESEGVEVAVRPMSEGARNLRRAAVVPGLGALRAAVDTIGYSLSLARHLRRTRPDLVVTNSLKSDLYGGLAARLAGIPVIWHLHDRIAPDYLPSPAVRLIQLAARFLPRGVIANSTATLETLGGRRAGGSYQVIGNVCPLADGALQPEASATQLPGTEPRRPGTQARGPVTEARPPGTEHRPLTVGIVGRLAPWKGQDVFLRAFARAFGGSDTQAVIVGGALFGEDDFAAELTALTEELGIADQVRFTGHLPDPWPEMASFDILVHASTVPEPFGQVIVEGMALGVCVVASDRGGPTELVTPDVDGLLVAPSDPAALAQALRRLGDDPALRHRLGSAGPRAAARFSAETIAAEEQQFYALVLNR